MGRVRVATLVVAGALSAVTGACSSGGGGGGNPFDRRAPVGSCTTTAPAPVGPGDAGNHMPLPAGAWWNYRVTERGDGMPARAYRERVRVTGTRLVDGVAATVATVSDLDDPRAAAFEVLLAKGDSALVRLVEAGADPISKAIGSYEVLEFPLEPGASFVQTHCEDLDLGSDLDGDGRSERLDYHGEVTVADVESVAVPAGTFVATRVDTRSWTAIQTSASGAYAFETIQRDWYAPGVGLVRSTVDDVANAYAHEEALVGYGVGGVEAGLVELRTLATGLGAPNSDTTAPGRPAIAFDGTGHLLVTVAPGEGFAQDTLRAHRVGPDGSVGAAFQPTSRRGYGFRPAVAFDGTNHLLVSAACETYCDRLFGQRIGPAGVPLDGEAGFDIPGAGSSVYPVAVASDGAGWMAVWTEYQVEGVQAARVGSGGSVLGHLALGAPWSTVAADPAIAYGGGQYLVAWAEDAIGIRAVRIASDGSVLDAQPILVSSVASAKAMGGIAWDGTRFLVTWMDARRGDTTGPGYLAFDVYAARVSPDGRVLDANGIEVNALPAVTKSDLAVAAVQGGFAVAWSVLGFDGDAGIHAARLTADGVLVDAPASGPGFEIARPSAYASQLVHPVVVGGADGRSLVVWVQNGDVSGDTKSIRSAVLAW